MDENNVFIFIPKVYYLDHSERLGRSVAPEDRRTCGERIHSNAQGV